MNEFMAYKTLVVRVEDVAGTDFSRIDPRLQDVLRSHVGSRQSELVSGDTQRVQDAARELVARYFQVQQ